MSDEMENKSVEEAIDTVESAETVETAEKAVEVTEASAESTAETTEVLKEEATETEEIPAEDAETGTEDVTVEEEATAATENTAVTDVVKKVKSNKKLLAVVAAALAVILVIVNAPKIGNAAVKLFTSPAGYFQHVEGKAVDEAIEQVAVSYDRVLSSAFAKDDVGSSAEVGVELGKDVRELLEDATRVDFDWLEKVAFAVKADSKKNASKTTIGLSLNGEQLISLLVMANLENGMGYLQIPELNESYLGMDLEEFFELCNVDMDMDDINEMKATYEEIYDALPDKSKLEKVMKRYSSLALSCVEDVTQDKKEVTVGDYTEKYTVLEATIDEETVQEMLEVIVKKLKEDKDVKKIIKDVVAVQDELDADEVYEEFLDALDDVEDSIDALDDIKFELVWKTYVNGKGEICGRVLEIEEAGAKVSSLMVKKGSKYAYELEAKVDGQKFSFAGAGKMTGSKLDGKFKLKVLSMKIADITLKDVKLKDLEDGYFSGTLSVSLSSVIAEAVERELDDFPFDVKDLVLKIDSDCGKSKADIKVSLYEEEKLLGVVYVESKTGNAGSIKSPKEKEVVMIEDVDDILDWVGDIDLDAFLDSLEGKVDDDILDLLDDVMSGVNFIPGFSGYDDDYYDDYGYDDYWYDEY